jgi:hypothetical protein
LLLFEILSRLKTHVFSYERARFAASCRANWIAALMLEGFAMPLPAML